MGIGEPNVPEAEQTARRFHVSLDYTLLSDDTGLKGNGVGHQFDVNPEYDFEKFGKVGALIWLESFNAPMASTDVSDTDLLEVDYGPYWAYDIDFLSATVQVGWIYETFPRLRGDDASTQELYVSVSFDDSKWFGVKEPVLNPFVAYFQDIDNSPGGRLAFGISHTFSLAEMGMKDTPFLKDVDISPVFLMEVDNGQLGHHWRAEDYQVGIEAGYDLTESLKLSPKFGRIMLTTFVYYRDALMDGQGDDRFYGGLTFSYMWQ